MRWPVNFQGARTDWCAIGRASIEWSCWRTGSARRILNRWSEFREPMLIKIVSARAVDGLLIRLVFSDGSEGDLDFDFAASRGTVLTIALREPEYFRRFFLELGALCWPNGLEFSAGSLREKLEKTGALRFRQAV